MSDLLTTRHGDVVLTDVTVTHRGNRLVDVPEVVLEPGRATTAVGESGSGKSLLASALMGTLPASLDVRGRVRLAGGEHDLADRAGRRSLWGRELALLPQEPVLALDPTMRVLDQVAEGAPGFRRDRRSASARAHRLLADVDLAGSSTAYPHELSGGMAQRVAFAAATIGGARLLVADEPTTGLDHVARNRLAELLRRHVEGGGLLLTITHDLDLARALGGRTLVMRDAEVVEAGATAEVLATPDHDYTRRLLAAEPARWQGPWLRPGQPAGEVLVSADRVSKSFGGHRVLDEVSLEVRAGERWSLTGPSGSGKTTLGRVLLGLTAPDSGTVDRSGRLGRTGAQRLYQDPTTAFPARVPLRTALGDVLRRHAVAETVLDQVLGDLGLDPALLDRRPGEVSGGELQRVAIARAVLVDPVLLFADEPTSRLDLVTQEVTLRCLLRAVDRLQCALLLVTHDEALAAAVTQSSVALGGSPPTASA